MSGVRLQDDLAVDVREGLSNPGQKELPSRLLWDDVGSSLFEVICRLPEYGLARAGIRLLERHAGELVERLPSPVLVAELGCGSGRTTRRILEVLARRQPVTYCPIDISPAALRDCQREMREVDAVAVVGYEGQYLDGLRAIASRRRSYGERLLVLFLGGTIGNFDRPAAARFLTEVRALLSAGDALLVAADLAKPVETLLAAYDDPLGVTAAFDKNALVRLNREFGADFDLERFRHEARWVEADRRIEMHLVSSADHVVRVPGADVTVNLHAGESIWTESSHRYTCEELVQLAKTAGFRSDAQWVDAEWPFAQSLLFAR